jgi:hypothetical protein
LQRPREEWRYTVQWPFGNDVMDGAAIEAAALLAAAVDKHANDELKIAEKRFAR